MVGWMDFDMNINGFGRNYRCFRDLSGEGEGGGAIDIDFI